MLSDSRNLYSAFLSILLNVSKEELPDVINNHKLLISPCSMAVYLPRTKTRHAFMIIMMMTKLKIEMNINEYGNDEIIEFYLLTEYY